MFELTVCVRFFALSECSILAQCLKAKPDAKPLLCAGRIISTKFNLKRNENISRWI